MTTNKLHVSIIPLAVAGLLSGNIATADTAADRGLMQCFYECKLNATGTAFQEQTTLMIMNGNQPPTAGAHPVTHIANLVFINGNEKVLGKAAVSLTPRDLDEVNVCATIARNTGGIAALPPAGIVQIAIDDELLSGPGQFVPGKGVDVAIKNPVGQMNLTNPEIFTGGNRITAVGKTSCFEIEDEPARLVFDPEVQAAPVWQPILIEKTEDFVTTPDPIPTDVIN
ncbi:MAG: hypothetical protein AABZ84_09245 [Pseudomonadota bacterium]